MVDEAGFAFHGLPGVAVEGPFDGVAEQSDLGVLVALAQAAAVALFDVGWAPRTVEVVQRDRAVLDVGPDSHAGGGADDHGDLAGAAGGEQSGLLGVVARLVDPPDLLGRHASSGELVAQLPVGVPARPGWGGEVAEHDLQRPGGGGGVAAGISVGAVAVLAPHAGDRVGGDVELGAARRRVPADEAHVQGGFAAVGGDQQHVVFLGGDGTGADLFGAIAEPGHVGAQLRGGRDQDRFGCSPPVGPGGELGTGELEIFCGARIGEHRPHAEHLGDVLKPAEAGVHAVVPAAGRGHLDLGDGLPERCCPAVEVLDTGGGEEVGAQVAAHDVRFGDAVGDRGGGRERDGSGAVAVAQPADLHV